MTSEKAAKKRKCDESQPQCLRCLRTKKPCSGYRNQLDLTFRNETARTRVKVQRGELRKNGSCARSAGGLTFSSAHATAVSTGTHYGHEVWAYNLSPAAEDVVICHFYHTTLANLSHLDPTRHLHLQLPSLYAKSKPGSALCLATEAISYAASMRLARQSAQVSRKRYVKAIEAIRTDLQDVREAGTDQTLYAVLLLCGYEVGSYPA